MAIAPGDLARALRRASLAFRGSALPAWASASAGDLPRRASPPATEARLSETTAALSDAEIRDLPERHKARVREFLEAARPALELLVGRLLAAETLDQGEVLQLWRTARSGAYAAPDRAPRSSAPPYRELRLGTGAEVGTDAGDREGAEPLHARLYPSPTVGGRAAPQPDPLAPSSAAYSHRVWSPSAFDAQDGSVDRPRRQDRSGDIDGGCSPLRSTLDRLRGALDRPFAVPSISTGALIHGRIAVADSIRLLVERLRAFDLTTAQALSSVVREYRTEHDAGRLREMFAGLQRGWQERVRRVLGMDKAPIVARLLASPAPDVLRILGKEDDENAHSGRSDTSILELA